MSNKVTFINRQSQQLLNIIRGGKDFDPENDSQELIDGARKSITFLCIAAIIALIGSTMPDIAYWRWFGLLSLVFLILYGLSCLAYYRYAPSGRIKMTATYILLVLMLTSCSGISAMFATDAPEPLIVLNNHDEYKMTEAWDFGFFGFGLTQASAKFAMEKEGLTKAYAIQTMQSFGPIAYVKVRVYGE